MPLTVHANIVEYPPMSFAQTLSIAKKEEAMSGPALPEPAHGDHDSMLSRKFGKEVANYFSGTPHMRPETTKR